MFNLFDLKESVKMIVALSDRRRKTHTIIEEMSRCDRIYSSAGSSYTVGREIYLTQAVIYNSLNSFNLNMKC